MHGLCDLITLTAKAKGREAYRDWLRFLKDGGEIKAEYDAKPKPKPSKPKSGC